MINAFVFKSAHTSNNFGVGTYLRQLTKALLPHKDISLFLVNLYSNKFEEFTVEKPGENHTEVHIPIPLLYLSEETSKSRYARRVVFFIKGLIADSKNIVFHTNGASSIYHVVKELKSNFSFPIVSIVHFATWQFKYNGSKAKYLTDLYENRIKDLDILRERKLYQMVDKVVTINDFMKDHLIQHDRIPKDKIEVIRNGIDRNSFKVLSAKKRQTLKAELGFSEDEKIVLFSGRLEKGKGVFFLLDAFAKALKSDSSLRLVLLGDGDLISCLKSCNNIWPKVSFTGYLPYQKVIQFYQVTDIGVIPSLYEQCGYVTLEMIAHRIPLVLSDIPGLDEVLKKDEALFVPAVIAENQEILLETKALSEAILQLAGSKETRDRLTINGHNVLDQKFSVVSMGHQMRKIYYKMVGPHPSHKPVT